MDQTACAAHQGNVCCMTAALQTMFGAWLQHINQLVVSDLRLDKGCKSLLSLSRQCLLHDCSTSRQCLLHDCSASRQGQSQYSRPVELSSYGDGLLWGAGLLLHLLNQTAWFKLTDLSALIVQRQQLEYRIAGEVTARAVGLLSKQWCCCQRSEVLAGAVLSC